MICQKCGAEIPDDSEFCLKCGSKLENDAILQESNSNEDSSFVSEPMNSDIQPEPKPKKKLNKLLIIIPIIVLVLIAGSITGCILYQKHMAEVENQKKLTYHTKITNTIIDITTETYASEGACGIISQAWNDAIFKNNKDFNTVIASYEKTLTSSDLGKNMKSGNAKIQTEMKELQNPYKGYENTYQLVLDLYDKYNGLYSQATNPTGSLTTYNSDVNSKEDSFNTTLDRIEVILPEIKSKVSK